MLRKPIFMQENLNPNENLNLSKEQTIKQSLIKNEEESLKKEDFNKFSKSTLDKIKNDEKNYEAQTKQTNSEENNNKFIFKYKDFHNRKNYKKEEEKLKEKILKFHIINLLMII